MNWRSILVLLAVACGTLGSLSCSEKDNGGIHISETGVQENSCRRIVSTAPNITETLFALGLENNVVGVTRFCKYPPEAQKKTIVGGYLDMNFETVAALDPDCVFCLPGHDELRSYLDQLKIRHITVANESIEDIRSTITTIGGICGADSVAHAVLQGIDQRISELISSSGEVQRPAVLVSIGREMGSGSLREVYIAGNGTFYDELIRLAGGRNAYVGPDILYPSLSSESLLTLNPDIILEIVPDIRSRGITTEDIKKDWQVLPKITAVKNRDIHVLTSDYTVIPGPRFILLLEEMAGIIQRKK